MGCLEGRYASGTPVSVALTVPPDEAAILIGSGSFGVPPCPEPTSWAIAAAGLAVWAARRRRVEG